MSADVRFFSPEVTLQDVAFMVSVSVSFHDTIGFSTYTKTLRTRPMSSLVALGFKSEH